MAQKKEVSLTQRASRLAKDIQKAQATAQKQIQTLEAERQQCVARIEPNPQVTAAKERIEQILAHWSPQTAVSPPIEPSATIETGPTPQLDPPATQREYTTQASIPPQTEPVPIQTAADDDWLAAPTDKNRSAIPTQTTDWLTSGGASSTPSAQQAIPTPDSDWLTDKPAGPSAINDDWLSELDTPQPTPKNDFW